MLYYFKEIHVVVPFCLFFFFVYLSNFYVVEFVLIHVCNYYFFAVSCK
jgi:hypothetical protein